MIEDVEHVFFNCPRFSEVRAAVQALFPQQPLTPVSVVGCMLAFKDAWNAVSDFAATVTKELRCAERQRRSS